MCTCDGVRESSPTCGNESIFNSTDDGAENDDYTPEMDVWALHRCLILRRRSQVDQSAEAGEPLTACVPFLQQINIS